MGLGIIREESNALGTSNINNTKRIGTAYSQFSENQSELLDERDPMA